MVNASTPAENEHTFSVKNTRITHAYAPRSNTQTRALTRKHKHTDRQTT